MSGKGTYLGGGTTFGPKDTSWWGRGNPDGPRSPENDKAPKKRGLTRNQRRRIARERREREQQKRRADIAKQTEPKKLAELRKPDQDRIDLLRAAIREGDRKLKELEAQIDKDEAELEALLQKFGIKPDL
jgi:seryl-tRNA synthetase